uniref:Uncharacterized protein n=1 Tax=Panagrolaimus davidi TaxID=227884 RepID=A0A914QI15_9BILA
MSSQPPSKQKSISNVEKVHGFRGSVLYYLKKNSNPRVLLKLMQVSKYFCFKEFPYMVVDSLDYDHINENIKLLRYDDVLYNDKYESLVKPLWITKTLNLYDPNDSKLASKCLSKIAVCDVKNLSLENQILDVGELKFYANCGSLESFVFRDSNVKYGNGTVVPIEEILKLLPKLKSFYWDLHREMASTFTSETTKTIIDFFDPSLLEFFCLMNIPEPFDFKLFAGFMDAHPSIQFYLFFARPLSAEYTKMLQDYVDDLIETELYKVRKILIIFPTQTDESFDILLNHFYGQ